MKTSNTLSKLRRYISLKLLRFFRLEDIRSFLSNDFLSPIQSFAKSGYTSILFKELRIESKLPVVVLGGYLGDSTAAYLASTESKIFVLEPIPQYFQELEKLFKFNSRVSLINSAAYIENGNITLAVEGERSGSYASGIDTMEVPAIDIIELMNGIGSDIGLVEINIEGGEYCILEKLIEHEMLQQIEMLQIQFHNLDFNHELQRAKIRFALSKTHHEIFNFEWVWERWVKKEIVDVD